LSEAGYAVLNDVVINQVLVDLWLAGADAADDCADSGGGNLLVRFDGVAREDGDADQRVELGYECGGCGKKFGGDAEGLRKTEGASRMRCAGFRQLAGGA